MSYASLALIDILDTPDVRWQIELFGHVFRLLSFVTYQMHTQLLLLLLRRLLFCYYCVVMVAD